MGGAPFANVEVRPARVAERRNANWGWLGGDILRIARLDSFECRYCGPRHLLVAYVRARRTAGESRLGAVPASPLRDLARKLSFVPAGSSLRDSFEFGGSLEATYLYVEPDGPVAELAEGSPQPRLLFENPAIWATVMKLSALVETEGSAAAGYAQALGLVLAHELSQLDRRERTSPCILQGGLAGWQQRRVSDFIEKRLAESIPLSALAEVARLSPCHFSRAFKRSFGLPPRRYHFQRRIERAKILLADGGVSVTDIGFQLGFAETSSFSAAFRRAVGQSPRQYRRGLV